MAPHNSSEKTFAVKNQKHICPKCSFENHLSAVYCEICFYPLHGEPPISKKSTVKAPKVAKLNNSDDNWQAELRKPSAILGLGVLGVAIALWANYLLKRIPQYLTSPSEENNIALYDSMSQVKTVPEGLFSYGGALYFASLVAHGMNDTMLQEHPNFNLRYTQPQDGDRSYGKGIQMLLDGELSFAFNGRPLVDEEYSQASLRGIGLQQVPIAIDGIVFFGNRNTTVDGISVDRVKDIFSGKITNWKELGGADMPITPVMLTPENIEILGLEDTNSIPSSTQYVDNYTLALRKVIATPGAIAFASASLAQKQKLIKVFPLARENSTNYISPFTAEGEPNIQLFQNGEYPLTRRLFVVFRQDGTPDRLAGKAYAEMLVSHQGQKIVERSGFVPLYSHK